MADKTTLASKKFKIVLKNCIPSDQYLDQHFLHHLMYLKDSWSEVKHKIRFIVNGRDEWWDLEILISTFAEQLNMSNMSNPCPQWPSNPFNRQPLSYSQLFIIEDAVRKAQIPINYVLKSLFDYLHEHETNSELVLGQTFLKYLSVRYRYRLINQKDSQDNYIGYWVSCKQPLSIFEQRYQEYSQIIPFQGWVVLRERPEYQLYREILDSIPPESVDLNCISLDYSYNT